MLSARPITPARLSSMVVAAPHRLRPFRRAFALLPSLAALGAACSHGEDGPAAAVAGTPTPRVVDEAGARAAVASGEASLVRGDTREAEGEFERAVELDPELAAAHFDLGQLRVQFAGEVVDSTEMAFARKNLEMLERGIASIQRAVELEPKNDEYVLWLGRAYHQADDLANARRCLEKAVELDPENSDAFKRLGMVYVAIPETELARAAFEKALALDPKDANGSFQLGQVLEVQRDLAGARAAYERAIANNPTQPEYYRKLMTVEERLGDTAASAATEKELQRWTEYEAKLKRRERVVNKSPHDATALRRLGEVYLEGERWKMAAEWCTKAVRADPLDAQAHLCCGIARRHLEDYEMAEKHLREAEFRDPKLLDPELELVRLYAATRDEKSLLAVVDKVERTAVADGASLFDLGSVCAEVGRASDAERLLAKARALGVTGSERAEPVESTEAPGGR